MQNPLQRRKNEPKKSNKRLRYKLQNHISTLRELETALREDPDTQDIKATAGTLRNDSMRWDWVERERQYTQLEEQELQDKIEDLFRELNQRGIHDMDEFIQELNELREHEMRQFRENGKKASSVMFTMRQYIKCYREATEIYYINTRHKIEPDLDDTPQQAADEKAINEDILSDENMNERISILKKLMNEK